MTGDPTPTDSAAPQPAPGGLCRWCCKPLPQGARVCTECSRSQSAPFEAAKQAITVATLLGLVFSSVAFVWPHARQAYLEAFSKPALAVVALRTERDMLIANTGRIAVFASHLDIYAPDLNRAAFVPIAATIEPGQTLRVDTRGLHARRVETTPDLPAWQASIAAPDLLFRHLDDDAVTPVYFALADYEYAALVAAHALALASSAARQPAASPAAGRILPINVRPATCRIVFSSAAQVPGIAEADCIAAIATKGDMAQVIARLPTKD